MSRATCTACASDFDANGVCPSCTAIAEAANVLGAFREGAPPPETESVPSILREYHTSTLGLFLFFLLFWLLVALAIAVCGWLGV